jgi:recombination protein RecA
MDLGFAENTIRRTKSEVLRTLAVTTMPASSLATLRSQMEADLRGRVASPFAYRDRNAFELVSTGVPEMDALVGGLPRGAITEICGAACSGRTSLLLSALASRTADGEVCALVDARDSFDPLTGDAAGIALKKLLWVRCQNIEQALRATDLLIQAGGFGMVAVDLSDMPTKTVRQVPLNAWFRFRRAVEDTPTILLLLEQEPHAKTCASLVVRLEARESRWTGAAVGCYPFANLLRGFSVDGDVVRSRIQMPEQRVVNIRVGAQPKMAAPLGADRGVFETETIWRSR